ncbi:hypothetical protein L7F22_061583 [Adiantum nelumboides]|nr:hypothetical protein [Adiantum nelumboides]
MDICVCAYLPEQWSHRTLLKDIERMHSNDAFWDMVFVCGTEEEEIRACRMLVAARSPSLQSMLLTSGMAESYHARILLPDIHPAAMRICLEFFYTDNIQQSSWPNIFVTLQVLKAAMFFLVKPLQILAVAHLKTVRLRDNKDAEWWASLVTSYNLGIELISSHSPNETVSSNGVCCIKTFLLDFRKEARMHLAGLCDVKLFSGSKYERRFYKDLTEPALCHFIQGHYDCEFKNGFSEYFTFLHVVRWSAYKVVAKEPSIDEGNFEKVLNNVFPQTTKEMGTMLSSAVTVPPNHTVISKYLKLLADPLGECLKRASIDFNEMPSHILCRFIEPLNVVPPSTLLAAYRFHALCRPALCWDHLAHGTQYKVDDAPDLISCSSSKLKGFARCSTFLYPAVNAFFDWEIKIWKACSELRIGFCVCKPTFRVSECNSHVLGDDDMSWSLDANGFLYNRGHKSSARYVEPFVKYGAIIQVHLNIVDQSCSFSIDNKDAGVAWSNLQLPDNHAIYPAVSLVSPGEAGIQLINHSWMDHLSKRLCFSTSQITSEATSSDHSSDRDTS